MGKRYITPAQRNVRIVNACRLAVLAFEENDYNDHMTALDKLMDLGEMEIAQGFACKWNNANAMEEEKGRTLSKAQTEAQGYEHTY